MKLNIFDLYISFCKNDVKIFEKIIKKVIEYHNGNPIIIIHFIFNKEDKVYNIKKMNQTIPCELIMIRDNICSRMNLFIETLEDIIDLFKINISNKGKNIFIYSGHSDGLILGHKHVYFISMDDFREIVVSVLGKKCDLIWGDACLMGNIGTLNSLRDATKYLIASPMYYNYDSVLELKNLYRFPEKKDTDRLITYGKNMIDEYMKIQRKKFIYKYFMVNIVFYEMNSYVDKLVNIVLNHKDKFEYDLCSINKRDYYYVDILCVAKNINENKIKDYLDKIIKYKKQYDIGNNLDSKLLIILREPYPHLEYDNISFFK
jgi:hypothetical protein